MQGIISLESGLRRPCTLKRWNFRSTALPFSAAYIKHLVSISNLVITHPNVHSIRFTRLAPLKFNAVSKKLAAEIVETKRNVVPCQNFKGERAGSISTRVINASSADFFFASRRAERSKKTSRNWLLGKNVYEIRVSLSPAGSLRKYIGLLRLMRIAEKERESKWTMKELSEIGLL